MGDTPMEPLPLVSTGAIPLSRDPKGSGPIDIRKIRLDIILVTALIGGVLSVSGAWWKMEAHASDTVIHADRAKSQVLGGVAYRDEVAQAQATLKDTITKSRQSTRVLLKSMTIKCTKETGGGFGCTVDLPETLD